MYSTFAFFILIGLGALLVWYLISFKFKKVGKIAEKSVEHFKQKDEEPSCCKNKDKDNSDSSK